MGRLFVYLSFLFVLIFKLSSITSLKVPYDAVQDAQTQLENLRAIVLGKIKAAEDELNIFYSEIEAYSTTVLADGNISIDQVYAEVALELQQIKDMAASDNKDISRCTGGREQMIHRLPTELKDRINTCIVTQNEAAADVLDSSRYVVDITINRVNSFEFQLRLCGDSEACIQPILEEIEKDIINIPQQIDSEVIVAEDLINELTVLVRECGDNNVADFTGYVTELVEQIADCADRIIDDICNGSCILPICCV